MFFELKIRQTLKKVIKDCKDLVATGTEMFIAAGVLHVELIAYQWFLLHIDRDLFIYLW